MSVLRMLVAAAVLLVSSATGCGSVRHPLDDSETKPPSAAAAAAEANRMLDRIGETTMASAAFSPSRWVPDSGCATHPDAPEQGDASRIIFRSYTELPATTSVQELLNRQAQEWEAAGYTTSRGSPSMPEQLITRVNGIGYSMVSTPPGMELRAFLPCY